jgi:hypothetical protein
LEETILALMMTRGERSAGQYSLREQQEGEARK